MVLQYRPQEQVLTPPDSRIVVKVYKILIRANLSYSQRRLVDPDLGIIWHGTIAAKNQEEIKIKNWYATDLWEGSLITTMTKETLTRTVARLDPIQADATITLLQLQDSQSI